MSQANVSDTHVTLIIDGRTKLCHLPPIHIFIKSICLAWNEITIL